jgi:hypothetical protein
VGSAAEEAAKLIGALGEWAKELRTDPCGLGGTLAASLTGLAGHAAAMAADLTRNVEDHLATGAPECTYCPICRTVHVVREAGPEVAVHLASAVGSLMQALASVVNAATTSAPGPRRGDAVEKIDLDDNQADRWPDPDTWEEQ